MAITHRIESLEKRHASIEEQLQIEVTRPAPNEDWIHELKKEKLFIKDEISRLATEQQAA